MKTIFFQLCFVCIVLTVQAQETRRDAQLPPARTSDPVVRQTLAMQPVLPLKSGDNARQQKPPAPVAVPLKSGGNAQQPKSLQQVEVPIRKTDGAVAAAPAGDSAQNKATKGKPVIVLPSSLSLKEAKEASEKPGQ